MLAVQMNGSAPKVSAFFHYGAFGEIVAQSGGASHRRGFNGKERDLATGLRYYGARYYDPVVMRWVSGDPLLRFAPEVDLTRPQQQNVYQFTLNNPIRYIDPDGRTIVETGCTSLGACHQETEWITGVRPNGGMGLAELYVETFKSMGRAFDNGMHWLGDVGKAGARVAAGAFDAAMKAACTEISMCSRAVELRDKLMEDGMSRDDAIFTVILVLGLEHGDLVAATIKPTTPKAAADGGRVAKRSPAESKIWKSFKSAGQGRRTSGSGKDQRFYEWDHTHGDIEVYDNKGRHLGSMEPSTGEMYKPAVKGRTIEL
jgi:RHS repeat-associated protein